MNTRSDVRDAPVTVLVVNAGSSSLKFTLYAMDTETVLARGIVERIGLPSPFMRFERPGAGAAREDVRVADHDEALHLVCAKLVAADSGVLKSLSQVQAIGHRVVHGGERIHDSVLVTPGIKDCIRDCFALAPLHNPPNLGGIEACERAFPGVPNVAVFDTAFHHTMPPSSYLYAIPSEYHDKHGIRKYGFHGTSHKFVAHATAELLKRPLSDLRLITCHLGNGDSITAVNGGSVLDTSMGMTPLNGLVMGTRSGDIDPAVVLYLFRRGMTADAIDRLLNKESGLLGVSGLGSSDMRDMIAAAESGNPKARLAIQMFVQRLATYIGAYFTLLGGADAVVFTGGIGENSAYIRSRVIGLLACLGCRLDAASNNALAGRPGLVSTPDSTLKAVVMPTNEELMIARDTVRTLTAPPRDASAARTT